MKIEPRKTKGGIDERITMVSIQDGQSRHGSGLDMRGASMYMVGTIFRNVLHEGSRLP